MKRWTLRMLGILVALLSLSVAQAQEDDKKKQENKKETPRNSPTEGSSEMTMSGDKENWEGAPRTYLVQPGDTLWDLSRRFLGSPWFWPKIWSKNPQIQNPHWIFPGNRLVFQSGEMKPEKKELEDISTASADKRGSDDVSVAGAMLSAPTSTGLLIERRESFVDIQNVEQSGEIVRGTEGQALLSVGDRIYVRFKDDKDIKPESKPVLSIFRKVQSVYDPASGKLVGYMIRLHGTVEITAKNDKLFEGTINDAFFEIESGYLVGPFIDHKVRVQIQRNESLVKGHVIRATTSVSLIGQYFQVFINRGSRHGLKQGNSFDLFRRGTLFREGDSIARRDRRPREKIGRAVVIDVRRESCVAIVLQSSVEIFSGDEAETTLDN